MKDLKKFSRLSLALLAGMGMVMGIVTTTHADVKAQSPNVAAVAKSSMASNSSQNQSQSNRSSTYSEKQATTNSKPQLKSINSQSKLQDQVTQMVHQHVHHVDSHNGVKATDYEEDVDSHKSNRGSWTRKERIDHLTGHKSETVTKNNDHKITEDHHDKKSHTKADSSSKHQHNDVKKNGHQSNQSSKLTSKQKKVMHKINVQLTSQMERFANKRKHYHYANLEANARDLGGYKTADHKYVVKPNLIIRSNNLYNLTPLGAEILKNKLHVYEIIDLRDSKEIAKRPDVGEYITKHKGHFDHYHLRIRRVRFPVYSDRGYAKTDAAVAKDGEVYRYEGLMDTTPMAIRAYRNVFKQLLKNHQGAILYHCIEGRDRTGLVSVLVLSALGVSPRDIMGDYLLTDYYNHKHPYFYQYNELKHFYRTIDYKYHGIHDYLTDVIGLTSSQIHKLRKLYLKKV